VLEVLSWVPHLMSKVLLQSSMSMVRDLSYVACQN